MPGGGKLTVETANRWLDDRVAHERDLPPGQYVSLCVSDTGVGMSRRGGGARFRTLLHNKAVGEGTGLGLSVIYGLVRLTGAHLFGTSQGHYGLFLSAASL